MSDREPPATAYRKLEIEADLFLSRLCPSFVPAAAVRQGGRTRDLTFFESFDGSFQGREGRWLVDVAASTNDLSSQKLQSIEAECRKAHKDWFDSALFILEKTPVNRPILLERLRNQMPGLFVEATTLGESKAAAGFDNFQTEYPGAFAEIGHNSEAYHATIEAIEAVTTRLALSNTTGLRADVRDRLLSEVRAGRTMLEGTTVRIAALGNTIVPALNFISDTRAKQVLGELAKEALKWLVKLIFS